MVLIETWSWRCSPLCFGNAANNNLLWNQHFLSFVVCVSLQICLWLAPFRHILTEPAIMQHLAPSAFKSDPRQHQDPTLPHSPMSLYPTTQRLTVQGGRIGGQRQQLSLVDKGGPAEPSGSEPQTQKTLHTDTPFEMCEDVLLKTLHNLVVEAVRVEFGLTAPPGASHRWRDTHSFIPNTLFRFGMFTLCSFTADTETHSRGRHSSLNHLLTKDHPLEILETLTPSYTDETFYKDCHLIMLWNQKKKTHL